MIIPFGPLELLTAWLLDVVFGDPVSFIRFHPIVWIGNLITLLEKKLLREEDKPSEKVKKGAFLCLITVGVTFLIALVALLIAKEVSSTAASLLAIFMAWACLSTGDLVKQVLGVAHAASRGQLQKARQRLKMIVGRDTQNLEEPEIMRAAFETAAENSSDGIIAPLFYLTLGALLGVGPTLGLAYKAANTLDSMVGYKSEKYLHFGRVSARFDDLLNWLPSRLCALIIIISAQVLYKSGLASINITLKDAKKHNSPNAGYPEAAFAGALGVLIGGTNYYKGVKSQSAHIGEPKHPIEGKIVRHATTLLWLLSALGVAFSSLVLLVFG
jgi:adenosylcobinamide-phosphate synthase